jgi:hypothetical protein
VTDHSGVVIERENGMNGSRAAVGPPVHPSWCDERECSVLPSGAGTHASQRELVPGEGDYATAVYVEQSAYGSGLEGPAHAVIGVMRAGVECTVQRWRLAAARAVHATLGEMLDRLDPDGSG